MHNSNRRWLAAGAILALVCAGWSFVIPRFVHHAAEDFSPRVPGGREEGPLAKRYNELMRLGMIPNIEGIAVVYSEAAHRFMDRDGSFRQGVSPAEAARILGLPMEKLAGKGGGPDVVLFRARTATLTPAARRRTRELRQQAAREGRSPGYVYEGWIIKDYAFTSDSLQNPTPDERVVLDSISRARTARVGPGDPARAISAHPDDLEKDDAFRFFPGNLPVIQPEP